MVQEPAGAPQPRHVVPGEPVALLGVETDVLALAHHHVVHQVQRVGLVNVAGCSHKLLTLLPGAAGGGGGGGTGRAPHGGGGGEVETTLNVPARFRTLMVIYSILFIQDFKTRNKLISISIVTDLPEMQ